MDGKRVSLRAEDFVDALPMPIDGNFGWKECRFALFEYTKRDGTVVAVTTAARILFVSEATEEEMVQHYSIADPKRFVPAADGKTLVPMVEGAIALNKSSNFFLLIKHLEDAGGGELLGDDISVLDGMVTHNIGVPEPSRPGLAREEPAEGRRVRVIAVPDEIIKLPGKGKAKIVGKGKAPVKEDALPATLAMLVELVGAEGSATRRALASKAMREKQLGVAKFVYEGLTDEVLVENSYAVDAEGVITIAE